MSGRRSGILIPTAARVLLALALPPLTSLLLTLAYAPGSIVGVACAMLPFASAMAIRAPIWARALGGSIGGGVLPLIALPYLSSRAMSAGFWSERASTFVIAAELVAATWGLALVVGAALMARCRGCCRIVLPNVWVISEWCRWHVGTVLVGVPYPYLQVGHAVSPDSTVAQSADIGGVWLVTWVVCFLAGAVVDAAQATLQQPRPPWTSGVSRVVGSVGAVVAVVSLYGLARIRTPANGTEARVVLVAEDAPAAVIDATLGTEGDFDAALWGEAMFALPADGDSRSEALDGTGQRDELFAHRALSKRAKVSSIVGLTRTTSALSGDRANSAVIISPQGEVVGFYDKLFPVPWSEYRPAATVGRRSRVGIASGVQSVTWRIDTYSGKSLFCSPLICYDVAFPSAFRSAIRRSTSGQTPDFFVVLAREGFDESFRLQSQMLRLTQYRAVETRRAVVRNAVDGFSGVVDGNGRVCDKFVLHPLNLPTAAVSVPVDRRVAAYCYLGEWVPGASMVALFGTLIARGMTVKSVHSLF